MGFLQVTTAASGSNEQRLDTIPKQSLPNKAHTSRRKCLLSHTRLQVRNSTFPVPIKRPVGSLQLCSIANSQGKQKYEIARQIASDVVSHLTVGKGNQGDSKSTDLIRVLGNRLKLTVWP